MYSSENLENKQSCLQNNDNMPSLSGDNSDDFLEAAVPVQMGSPPSSTTKSFKSKRGHSNKFPQKLFDMLQNEDASIISWTPLGDAFIVRSNDRFVSDLLPRYFRHTKVASFQRQLNLYGFRRIRTGPVTGAQPRSSSTRWNCAKEHCN